MTESTFPVLEIICDVCNGSESAKPFCDKCSGAGYIPTEAGKRILELIQHNLRFRDGDLAWFCRFSQDGKIK